jgi:hypothetical protein
MKHVAKWARQMKSNTMVIKWAWTLFKKHYIVQKCFDRWKIQVFWSMVGHDNWGGWILLQIYLLNDKPCMNVTSFRVQIIFKVIGWRCFNIKVMFSNFWVLLVLVFYLKKSFQKPWGLVVVPTIHKQWFFWLIFTHQWKKSLAKGLKELLS